MFFDFKIQTIVIFLLFFPAAISNDGTILRSHHDGTVGGAISVTTNGHDRSQAGRKNPTQQVK